MLTEGGMDAGKCRDGGGEATKTLEAVSIDRVHGVLSTR